jgi:hypothetical protein
MATQQVAWKADWKEQKMAVLRADHSVDYSAALMGKPKDVWMVGLTADRKVSSLAAHWVDRLVVLKAGNWVVKRATQKERRRAHLWVW